MSIYSANRSGYAASATIVANESYGADSLGRILYETQINDQAIFEAVVATDMRECKAIQEGTLLKSEILAMNEASVKDFFTAVGERLKKFWEKIKGAFKNVINKILAYVLKDGKAYVKEFENKYKGPSNVKGTIEKYFDRSKVTILDYAQVEKAIRDNKNGEDDKAQVIEKSLGASIGIASCTPKEYRSEKFVEVACGKKDLSIDELKKTISDGPTAIKDLKKIEKDVDTYIGKFAKSLKDEEKKAAKEAGKNAGDVVKRISMLVSAYETVTTIVVSACINGTKANMHNSVKALAKILKDSKAVTESAAVEEDMEAEVAVDTVDTALDNNIDTEVDTETQEEINDIVDNVEVAVDADKE